MSGMGMDMGMGLGSGGGTSWRGPLSVRDEFSTVRASAAINGSAMEPGAGTRTLVDTETCVSTVPDFGAALATHAGVTFGGANNQCIYTDGTAAFDYPTGFDASLHKNLGRMVVQTDSNGRSAWAFLGGQGVAATACLVFRDAALTVSGWHCPTAFLKNTGSSYTFGIYQPIAGQGRLFFQGGKGTADWLMAERGSTAITRAPGQICAAKVLPADVTKSAEFGLDSDTTGNIVGNGFRMTGSQLCPISGSTVFPAVIGINNNVNKTLAVVLRAAGAHFFRKRENGNWKRLCDTAANTTTPLYAGFTNNSMNFLSDWMRLPFLKWLPTPLVSDNFTRVNGPVGTSNGLGHAEATGLGSGGAGVAWSGSTGAIVSNRLVITPELGPELVTNGGFDTDTVWVKGTGWSIIGGSAVHTGTSAGSIQQPNILSINDFYKASYTVLSIDGAGLNCGINNVNYGNFYPTTTGTYSITGRPTTTTLSSYSTNNSSFDDMSVRKITLSTCFQTVILPTPDIEMKAAVQCKPTTAIGVVLAMSADGLNFILAYIGVNGWMFLEICISGTYTSKLAVAVAHSADNHITCRYGLNEATGLGEIWLYYGPANAPVLQGAGPTTTLSSGETAALRGLRAGLFSTSELNSFGMAVAFAEGGGGEFNFLDFLIGTSVPTASIYDIGYAGAFGFGVATYQGTLPSGFTALSGHDSLTSNNYGNYQYSDGSIMCWVPKFYYRIFAQDFVDVKPAGFFANTAAANAAGYALHRAFIDGGVEKAGFFVDKYACSKNARGTGWVASSIANGNPISTNSAHNPIADLTATAGVNLYHAAVTAPKARDGVNGNVNPASNFHCASRFQIGALALLSLAHAQASTGVLTGNAWYNATSNFPKGNNNNALSDANDSGVLYAPDGYSNCGKTGSGTPFAKTTHNGQPSGVCDLNGNMWGISIGATCIATTVGIEGLSRANPCVVTWAGHGLVTGDYVQILSITQSGWTVLNDKIYSITYIDANSFSLQGVDTSALGTAYDPGDPGTITKGTFYVAKESTAMKTFTPGNTIPTDHWGAAGCAAMMEVFVPAFETAYPNNGFAQRFGDGTGQVLSPATSGAGGILTGLGFPASAAGISTSGTATFGTDYFYQYIKNELCLLSGGSWYYGSPAGVWLVYWANSRSYSDGYVGFRGACYPE